MNDKNKLPRSVGLSVLALGAALLMGCGQKGPLVLPKPPQAATSAPSAAAASAVQAKQ
ncbi:lipoprotein [Paucibacter sp. R3-3]|uniref:Lipoprotein n=1 Tax=Roseateles agri TaxID=3098619 RepID=A0ABU5DDJ4_9BURK|nr:lipoprotein [Paucibacter sp. R3-3]MDY0744353.1 lipoprotein [Paucibacter sp. R3-3]